MWRVSRRLPFINSTSKRNWSVDSSSSSSFRSPLGWGSVLALSVIGGGVVSYYQWLRSKRLKALETKTLGRPAIGGPFTLVDHLGRPVTDSDFRGHYMLVYFGFTYCPDICPAELTKMGNVMQELQSKQLADMVVPVMISVDPRRDTVAQLARYVKEFHPRLVGLTGTPEQTQEVAKLYRVYASTGLTEEELEKQEDYLVDHTIFFYLMGPDGLIRSYYGKQMSSDQISSAIAQVMREDVQRENGVSFWDVITGK